MTKYLSTWIVSGLALAFAAWLLGSKMSIGDSAATTTDRLIALAIVAAIFTAVHAIVGSVVKTLSLPLVLLSLGLALIVINALLLLLTEWITDKTDFAEFAVAGFWWAVVAAIVVSIAQSVIGVFIRD